MLVAFLRVVASPFSIVTNVALSHVICTAWTAQVTLCAHVPSGRAAEPPRCLAAVGRSPSAI